MKRSLITVLVAGMVLMATAAFGTTQESKRFLGQVYSGYSATVQGQSYLSAGGKFLYYNRPDMRVGAVAWYETQLTERVHVGGAGFVMDYVLRLSPSVDFFAGAHLGVFSGSDGPALYLEPGIGFSFFFSSNVGMELRASVKAPWMIGNALHLDRDTQVMATVSMVFGRW